jgi:acyl-CoA dehydrogenase
MARTDPDVPKHQGLTMFLLPMHTPGVEARPLRQMNGNAEFNEVFLTDVRVPDANRVGAPGSGWRAVLTTLMSERAAVGSGKTSPAVDAVALLMALARHLHRHGDPVVRQHLAEVHTHQRLIEWLSARAEAAVTAGHERGAEGSIVKLIASRQNRQIGAVRNADCHCSPSLVRDAETPPCSHGSQALRKSRGALIAMKSRLAGSLP